MTEQTVVADDRDSLPAVTLKLVAALDATWSAIRHLHPDVPDVVVTLGSGTLGMRGGVKLGHFAAARWQVGDDAPVPELFIGGEGLARGAEGLLTTLLHEAAHGMALTREIQDTSRQGRYHNAAFAELAGELGLTVTKDATIGYSPSELADGTAALYVSELAELAAALTAHRLAEPSAGRGTRKDTNLKPAVCGCERRIRVAASVLEQAPITCGACGETFELAE